MKVAQNNLLKEKSAVTVVEGELTHFRNLLAKFQQQSQQKPVQQEGVQATISKGDTPLKETGVMDLIVTLDEPEQFATSTTRTDQQASTSDDIKETCSDILNVQNHPADAAISTETITSDCTNPSLSFDKRLNSQVLTGSKVQPGQKIASVVKKLTQDHVIHAPSIAVSDSEEVAMCTEDKNTRKSLDAVVAKLHIVKNQELDKQFHVDLGSSRLVRENTKLDSVVEKLVAKQTHSQPFASGYPVHFEALGNKEVAKINTAVVSSSQHMEADVSSTVHDNLDSSKERRQNIVCGINTKQADNSKVKPKWDMKETVNTDSKVTTTSTLSSKETKQKEGACSPNENILATINKFVMETFAIKPKDLLSIQESNNSKEISDNSFSGSLTEFYAENSQVCTQQDISVPDAVFVKLLQVL